MTTLSLNDLDAVSGGRSVTAQNVCNLTQYKWMVSQQVSDHQMGGGGVQRHVLVRDAQMCGFPPPPPLEVKK